MTRTIIQKEKDQIIVDDKKVPNELDARLGLKTVKTLYLAQNSPRLNGNFVFTCKPSSAKYQ